MTMLKVDVGEAVYKLLEDLAKKENKSFDDLVIEVLQMYIDDQDLVEGKPRSK